MNILLFIAKKNLLIFLAHLKKNKNLTVLMFNYNRLLCLVNVIFTIVFISFSSTLSGSEIYFLIFFNISRGNDLNICRFLDVTKLLTLIRETFHFSQGQ